MKQSLLDLLGPFPSNVELDREMAIRLSELVEELRALGVSQRHVVASILRVATHSGRRL